ncbi:MAG: hypothetical protein Q4B80_01835 [Aerococcaceae bacterium]|nr:hypothetical protein [Aerococcaceae bacterium]
MKRSTFDEFHQQLRYNVRLFYVLTGLSLLAVGTVLVDCWLFKGSNLERLMIGGLLAFLSISISVLQFSTIYDYLKHLIELDGLRKLYDKQNERAKEV